MGALLPGQYPVMYGGNVLYHMGLVVLCHATTNSAILT